MKLVFSMVVLVFLTVVAALRAKKGREDVARLEAGEMCIHCHSNNVEKGEKGIRCLRCGQTTSWALISSPKLTQAEVAKLHEPERRSPWR